MRMKMHNNLYKIIALCLVVLNTEFIKAQGFAEVLAGNTKFNVVVVVLTVIFIGIVVYLIRLDNKIKRLERKNKQ